MAIERLETARNDKGGYMLLRASDYPVRGNREIVMEGSMEEILGYIRDNNFEVKKVFAMSKCPPLDSASAKRKEKLNESWRLSR